MISPSHQGPRPANVFAELNFQNVQFPSDEISVRRLREINPAGFDAGFHEGSRSQPVYLLRPEERGNVTDHLGNMLFCERYLVTYAYALARGINPPDGEYEGLRENLAQLYVQYRVASGPQHAEQLMRDLETRGRQIAAIRTP